MTHICYTAEIFLKIDEIATKNSFLLTRILGKSADWSRPKSETFFQNLIKSNQPKIFAKYAHHGIKQQVVDDVQIDKEE